MYIYIFILEQKPNRIRFVQNWKMSLNTCQTWSALWFIMFWDTPFWHKPNYGPMIYIVIIVAWFFTINRSSQGRNFHPTTVSNQQEWWYKTANSLEDVHRLLHVVQGLWCFYTHFQILEVELLTFWGCRSQMSALWGSENVAKCCCSGWRLIPAIPGGWNLWSL